MEHLLEQIMDYRTFVNSNGFLERNRSRQLQYWFHESLQQQLMNQLTERFLMMWKLLLRLCWRPRLLPAAMLPPEPPVFPIRVSLPELPKVTVFLTEVMPLPIHL